MGGTQNHVWGPPGARDMSIFAKHVFAEIVRGYDHGRKERQRLFRMVFSKYQKDERWFALSS